MPTVYVDRATSDAIRDVKMKMERERAREQGVEPRDVYVSEKEALETMLTDEAKRRVQHNR